jgi:hypothetical protein
MNDHGDSQWLPGDAESEDLDSSGVVLSRLSAWDRARGQREVSVPLAYLPRDIDFTQEFPEPIRYDADKLKLVYRGVMPSASYHLLRNLSKDLPFQLAIDRLFALSAAAPRRPSRWIACGSLSLAAVVLLGVSLAVLTWPGAQREVEEVLDLDGPPPAVVDIEPADVLEAVDSPDAGNDDDPLLSEEEPASS